MNVTLRIPDELAERLRASGAELERRALEAFAIAEYQAGRLFESDLCQMLGVSRYELDGLLKARSIFHDDMLADLERERRSFPDQSEDERQAARDLVARFKAFRAGKTLGGLSIKELIAEGRR